MMINALPQLSVTTVLRVVDPLVVIRTTGRVEQRRDGPLIDSTLRRSWLLYPSDAAAQ